VTLNAMVWRMHFTADDMARIQVSPTLGPLAETVMAVALLRSPQQPRTLLSEWRGQVQGKVTPRMRRAACRGTAGTPGTGCATCAGS
jgi:hypothetical protein